MKQTLLKILKVFLVVSAVLVVVALVFGLVLGLDWPWWVALFILLGLVGIGIGLFLLKKAMLRKREQHFVQEIIEQDNAALQAMGAKEKAQSQEIQTRWKEAMEALRRSHLRKRGNPLYVLPWYVVIGESGSGKTTAIQSARLSSPFAEVTRTSGISGTRNCDWWFFEQAILIDTAGRYAIPVDQGRDKEEWQKFLTQLAKYRKKEPINGLVVTVAADKLLEAAPEVLEADAKSIRMRIDELMRVLGAKFPVYVLVTKCDLIQGMTQFCDRLPQESLQQAMGLVNYDLSKDVGAFFTRGLGVIADRLRDLRLLLFHKQAAGQGVDPGLLLFPEEFTRLKSGLGAFLKAAFQENPYQETPLLRGLYFSSGRQEGTPYSHFLKALGLIREKDVLPGTNRGLFLHDFFGRILPSDRGLFAPTQRAIEWSRLTRNLGLTAWVAVVIALCGLLSFSFVKNLRTLRVVSREFAKPPVLSGDVVSDVVVMDHFRQAIVTVEDQNANWWIPRFGLNESKNVEERLKARYCEQFRDGFLAPFDKEMGRSMAHFSSATPDRVLGEHVAHLARRINLLKARLEGRPADELGAMPQPTYAPVTAGAQEALIPEIRAKFSGLYLSYLVWRADKSGLNQEMNELRTWLTHLLTLNDTTLSWVVTWVNTEGAVAPVTLKDFWGGDAASDDEIMVASAFTVAGRQKVEAFLKEIESALVDPLILARKKLEFESFYRQGYLQAWYAFGQGFGAGARRLQSREQRQQAAAAMPTDKGPYFALLDTMAEQLAPVAKEQKDTSWVKSLYAFKTVKLQAAQQASLKGKGALAAKATQKGRSLVAKLERTVRKLDTQKSLESELAAATALRDYREALFKIAPVATSRGVAFQMGTQTYTDDPATSQSPVFAARAALDRLKAYFTGGTSSQEMFWALVGGPLDYMWSYIRTQTACRLQELWEKDVLVELQGISSRQAANKLLLGDDGLAVAFVKGPAAPFVGRSVKKGYYAKRVLNKTVPFTKSFLTFLTKGARSARPVQATYSVTIRGLPTDTNKGAKLRAHATRLEIQCAQDTKTLVNLNYPVSKTVAWSPQDCGDVIFQIEVGKLVLTKKYEGFQGLPMFLKDFSSGRKTFYPGDFPDKEAALRRLGIKSITAKYRFKGHKAVMKLLGAAPGEVPRTIVACWDQ